MRLLPHWFSLVFGNPMKKLDPKFDELDRRIIRVAEEARRTVRRRSNDGQ